MKLYKSCKKKGLSNEKAHCVIFIIATFTVIGALGLGGYIGWRYFQKVQVSSKLIEKIEIEKELPYTKPSGEKVHLINNRLAKDPTWEELISFLKTDSTDDNSYKEDSFNCTNFAETLHNNAERSGFRTAFVAIEFVVGQGHAVNAFYTVDRGLIFVDSTGKGFSNLREDFLNDGAMICEWDKIAYLSEGKKYGVISITYPDINPIDYQFYEEYSTLWAEATAQLLKYNGEILNYNQIKNAYEDSVLVYEQDKETYEQMLTEYDEKVSTTEARIQQEYADERDSLESDVSSWEKQKKEYEREVEDYNEQVARYNNEGVGDPKALESQKQSLDLKRGTLNFELSELNRRTETLNEEIENKIAEENEMLQELKDKLDDTWSVLEGQKENLDQIKDTLDNLTTQLKEKLNILKLKEENLDTCYFKPLGEVTEIKTYW